MVGLTAHDIHPPLYYGLLHGWLRAPERAGSSHPTSLLGYARRACHSGDGMACAPVSLHERPRTVLLATLLLAFSPMHLFYCPRSTHVRSGLGPRASPPRALFWKLVTRPTYAAIRRLCLTATLGLYTLYYLGFLLLAHALWGLWIVRQSAAGSGDSLGAFAPSALLYLPWLLYAGPKLVGYVGDKVTSDQDTPLNLAPLRLFAHAWPSRAATSSLRTSARRSDGCPGRAGRVGPAGRSALLCWCRRGTSPRHTDARRSISCRTFALSRALDLHAGSVLLWLCAQSAPSLLPGRRRTVALVCAPLSDAPDRDRPSMNSGVSITWERAAAILLSSVAWRASSPSTRRPAMSTMTIDRLIGQVVQQGRRRTHSSRSFPGSLATGELMSTTKGAQSSARWPVAIAGGRQCRRMGCAGQRCPGSRACQGHGLVSRPPLVRQHIAGRDRELSERKGYECGESLGQPGDTSVRLELLAVPPIAPILADFGAANLTQAGVLPVEAPSDNSPIAVRLEWEVDDPPSPLCPSTI